MSILDPKTETASRADTALTQLERLQATINRVYRHVKYYREAFDKAGVAPEDIRSLDDLRRLPLTSRGDLLAHQPYDLFAVPLRDVLRLHPAAGAGGPVVVGYTRNDIATWTRMSARALASAGVTRDDVVQILLDYALNAAAIGAQSGAEVIGASVIPCPGLSPERLAEVMRQYRATVLVAAPQQALHLGRVVRGLDPATVTLRSALIVGEVWSDALRGEIEALLHVEAFGSYGMSEMASPGLATECERHNGLHVSEDNVLAEVIDPVSGAPLLPGAKGELVLTTLTREGFPLLRYRTGDLTTLDDAPCPCGRSSVRMAPPHARADNVMIVSGVRVSPSQVESIARGLAPVASCEMATVDEEGLEVLEIRISLDPDSFPSEMRRLQDLRDRLRATVYERLGLRAEARFVEPPRRKPR